MLQSAVSKMQKKLNQNCTRDEIILPLVYAGTSCPVPMPCHPYLALDSVAVLIGWVLPFKNRYQWELPDFFTAVIVNLFSALWCATSTS
jgi:hypothetical protein